MSIAAVRQGIVERLNAAIPGLHVYGVWPDQVNPPAALVELDHIEAHTTFSGRGSYHFAISMVVKLGRLDLAQQEIDEYLDLSGPKSIVAALEADQTLGGAAEGLQVGDWFDYRVGELSGVDYFAARLRVEVWVQH